MNLKEINESMCKNKIWLEGINSVYTLNKLNLYYFGQKCNFVKFDEKYKFYIKTVSGMNLCRYVYVYKNYLELNNKEFKEIYKNEDLLQILDFIKLSEYQINYIFNNQLYLPQRNYYRIVKNIIRYYDLTEDFIINKIENNFDKSLLVSNTILSLRKLSCDFLNKYFDFIKLDKSLIYSICKYQDLEEWLILKYIINFNSKDLELIINKNKMLSDETINKLRILSKLY